MCVLKLRKWTTLGNKYCCKYQKEDKLPDMTFSFQFEIVFHQCGQEERGFGKCFVGFIKYHTQGGQSYLPYAMVNIYWGYYLRLVIYNITFSLPLFFSCHFFFLFFLLNFLSCLFLSVLSLLPSSLHLNFFLPRLLHSPISFIFSLSPSSFLPFILISISPHLLTLTFPLFFSLSLPPPLLPFSPFILVSSSPNLLILHFPLFPFFSVSSSF